MSKCITTSTRALTLVLESLDLAVAQRVHTVQHLSHMVPQGRAALADYLPGLNPVYLIEACH